jgi:peroxiredoxin
MMTTNTKKTIKLLTGIQVPELEVKTLDGKLWQLSEQKPQNFTLIIFYRGWFCPICHSYLGVAEKETKQNNFWILRANKCVQVQGKKVR